MNTTQPATELLTKQLPSTKIMQTTCAYCGVGCGVDITATNQTPLTLTGTPEHPANHGRLCIKGKNLLATHTRDNRLLTPMIDNQDVTWEHATNYVAEKFSSIIKEHGKEAVAFYVSGQLLTEDYYVANKLMKGYIGTANIDTNSRLCMSSAVAAYKRSFGEDIVPCSYSDLENTELLLLIGSNAAWAHPVLFQRIERAKKINPLMKVVVIDPRRTATCDIADYHLALKSGTDAAFFNGLLQYIFERDALDYEFVSKHTQGFEQTIDSVSDWDVEAVSQYCDLDANELREVYQLFTKAESAISMYSMGINQSSSGVDKANAIINAHLARGLIGKVGSGPFSITGQPNAMGGREVGGLSNQLAAHMDIENPEHRQTVQRFWQSPKIAQKAGYPAVELFDKIKQGKIKAVWIMATNPLVSLPNRKEIEQALEMCELVVVSDCVAENDTLTYADVKLPATTWLEKNGTVTNSERCISRQRGIAKPMGQAKHDWQIMCDVAKAMGFSGFDYTHPAQIFTEHAALSGHKNEGKRCFDISGLSSLTQSQYDAFKPIQWPVNQSFPNGCKNVFANNLFSTPSKKARFVAIDVKAPLSKASSKYPLILNTGRIRDQWHTMTRTANAPLLNQHIDKPMLAVNSVDADKLGLKDNDLVKVSSINGAVIVSLQLSKAQRVGECFLPIHWNKQFASQANVSNIVGSYVDPISAQPETKFTPISVEKVEFTHSINVYTRVKIVLEKLTELEQSKQAVYWLRNSHQHCSSYDLALTTQVAPDIAWFKNLGLSGNEWLEYKNVEQGLHIVVVLTNNTISAIIHIASESNGVIKPIEKSTVSWLDHIFSTSTLTSKEILAVLAGEMSAEFAFGKQICSCFNVSEKVINDAIDTGFNSIEKLGDKLKCGTNCGSCKTDLSAMIATRSSDKVGRDKIAHNNEDLLSGPLSIEVTSIEVKANEVKAIEAVENESLESESLENEEVVHVQ